jgi:hypothetical protein
MGGYHEFLAGWHSYDNTNYEAINLFTIYFGKFSATLFDILYMLGLLIYMLSKEKIEDEYIKILRLESYQLVTILGICFSLISYALSKNLEFTLDYFIFCFMVFYLVIFSLKKRQEI